MPMSRTVILDFDGSVAGLDGAEMIDLRNREEEIRFGCAEAALRALPPFEPAGIVFMGSGDFHHVSAELIARQRRRVQVLVLDNHPDNMRYPFGIHCGSWVAHVARLPEVSRVHVAGITSPDVESFHAFENHLGPLRSGKVVYWCLGRSLRMLRMLGVRASQSFEGAAEMSRALLQSLSPDPIYLSIDKDVLAPEVVQTNWDQGVMHLHEVQSLVESVKERVIGCDVVGDVSAYRYRSRLKRILSALDDQPEISGDSLELSREMHRLVNRRLVSLLGHL